MKQLSKIAKFLSVAPLILILACGASRRQFDLRMKGAPQRNKAGSGGPDLTDATGPATFSMNQEITSLNRTYSGVYNGVPQAMYGCWNPALRLITSEFGSRWAMADQGFAADPTHISNINIFRQSQGGWDLVAPIYFGSGMSFYQPGAQIEHNGKLFEYLSDYGPNHYMYEYWFDPANGASGGGPIGLWSGATRLSLGSYGSYYNGAAVNGNMKVVWWTTVGQLSQHVPATFNYIYNYSDGWNTWNGPVTITLPTPYTDVSYGRIRFTQSGFVMATNATYGQYTGAGSAPYHLGLLRVSTMGQPASFITLDSRSVSLQDMWLNPANDDVHILYNADNADGSSYLYYYLYSPSKGINGYVDRFSNYNQAVFMPTSAGSVYTVVGDGSTTLSVYRIDTASVGKEIPMTGPVYAYIDAPWSPSGLFVTNPAQQDNPVTASSSAVAGCGPYAPSDNLSNQIWETAVY